MSILQANLKQLCRPRALFLLWILIVCLACAAVAMPLSRPVAGEGRFIGLVALALVLGILVASIQMEILTKPFAFSLPGHRRVVRRLSFSVAVVGNALSCLLFLRYPGVPGGYVPVVLASAFCAGLVFYLAGIWLGFSSGQPMAFVGFLILAFFGGHMLSLHVVLEEAIVEAPLPVIVLGLLAAGAGWRYLSDENLARRNCLRPWMGFGAAFDPQKAQRIRERGVGPHHWQKLKDHPRQWVRDAFLGQMNRQTPLATSQFVWGHLYATFAIGLSQWKSILCSLVLLPVVLGYMGRGQWVVVFFAPMLAMQVRPALYSNMLTPGGRDQRFAATLAAAAVGAALLVLVVALIVLASILLAVIVPDIEYRGLSLQYHRVSPRALWVVALLPVMYALRLIFFRRPVLLMGATMGLIYAVILPSWMPQRHLGPALIVSPVSVVSLTVLLWIAYISVVYYIARKGCLVR